MAENIISIGDNDTVTGSEGGDVIGSSTGDDSVRGEGGDDFLNGNQGNDVVLGGDGVDSVSGGQGDDTVSGDAGDDIFVNGNLGDDNVEGGAGNDINVRGGKDDDRVNGNGGDDSVYGDLGADTLHGGQGNDLLVGGGGLDVLYGDLGNDTMTGGTGDADRFAFDGAYGHDVITDFVSGLDKLYFTGGIFTSAAQAVAAFSNGVITTSGGTITLSGLGSIVESDIIFTATNSGIVSAGGGSNGGTPPAFGATLSGTSGTFTLTGQPSGDYTMDLTQAQVVNVLKVDGVAVSVDDSASYAQTSNSLAINASAVQGSKNLTVTLQQTDAGDFTSFNASAGGTATLALKTIGNYTALAFQNLAFDAISMTLATGGGYYFDSDDFAGRTVEFIGDDGADYSHMYMTVANKGNDLSNISTSGTGGVELHPTSVDSDYSGLATDLNVFSSIHLNEVDGYVTLGEADLDDVETTLVTDSVMDDWRIATAAGSTADFSGIDYIRVGNGTLTLVDLTAGDFTGVTGLTNFLRIDASANGTHTFAASTLTGTDMTIITNGAADIVHVATTVALADSGVFSTISVGGGGSLWLSFTDGGTVSVAGIDGRANFNGSIASVATNFIVDATNWRITGSTGADSFTFTAANFSSADTIAGGTGSDNLIFSNAVNIGNTEFTNLTGIDVITLQADSTLSFTSSNALADNLLLSADAVANTIEINNGTNLLTLFAYAGQLTSGNSHLKIAGTGTVTLSPANNRVEIKDGVNGTLIGSVGDETLTGGTGNDNFTGVTGADRLTGGDGNDVFHYAQMNTTNNDTITDFTAGSDDLSFDAAGGGTFTLGDSNTAVVYEEASTTDIAGNAEVYVLAIAGGFGSIAAAEQVLADDASVTDGGGAIVVALIGGAATVFYDNDKGVDGNLTTANRIATLSNITTDGGITGLAASDFAFF